MKSTAKVSFTFNVGMESTSNSVSAKFEFLHQNAMGAPKPDVLTHTAPESVSENKNMQPVGNVKTHT